MSDPTVPLIPLRHFFDNPERAGAQISPDGTRLAYLAPENNRLNVWVRTIGLEDDACVTHDHRRGILGYTWSRDGKRILYVQDDGGNENFLLYSVDPMNPDAEATVLTPYENVRVSIVDMPRATPSKVLIAMNKRNPQLFEPHRLDIESGGVEQIAENPGDIVGWLTDGDGKLRAALAQTGDGGWDLRVRETEDEEFRSLGIFSNEDEAEPYAFTPDGRALYVGTARGAEFKRLVKIDLATGAETLVDEDDESDLVTVVVSDKTKALLGAVYQRDRFVLHAFDERFGRDWENMQNIHAGDPQILGMDADETKIVVAFIDDVDPGASYIYDRETAEATFLWRSRPWLNAQHLAPMQPITFSARDGLTIHGYLTLPVGVEPRNLPLVLNVHGGPWARDIWGFNPEVQLLANRGYAVLQVNYRGSTGYGKKFKEAAVHEWAGKMHDDLIDAVEWAVSSGIADPSRVAIIGGSYGGYATLVGLTFTPDVFACGVSLCGPSSLITLTESFPPYWKPILAGSFFKHIGNPEVAAEREDMERRSPLNFIDRITAPLLIGQGANDVRVTQKESDQIVDALRARSIDVGYVLKDDEGHGFQNPENRIDFYGEEERFLAKHLGGRTES
ncbi:MAG: alpha/beta fold hydrolase [Actinomycetota bacterium]